MNTEFYLLLDWTRRPKLATKQNYSYISDKPYEGGERERDKTSTKEIVLVRSSELFDKSSVIVMTWTNFSLR